MNTASVVLGSIIGSIIGSLCVGVLFLVSGDIEIITDKTTIISGKLELPQEENGCLGEKGPSDDTNAWEKE
jgi:hypothetical protein